ncbi:LPS export ABC transporter periplasmic protein LptC [Thermodesulforhabdus norvegica]|uniref:LPS export ABC transporter protein LptC n=1 Tax=Thermodesulforhabdus norvegica TaxID=39841 RepID=A0A1I4VJ43_9BACT|nr:LPS export ABC transporter periplasmic protein LptC [Thermodesulforhabdus norvegica]SFN01169.1 LPS export ABC transporter protein LptC [Thermodesulforhabdus norvegica]
MTRPAPKPRSLFKILWGFIIGGLILSLFLFVSGRKPENRGSIPETGAPEQEGSARIENMEYTEVDGGKVKWTLRAQVATYFKTRDLTELEKVQLLFYLDDGSVLEMRGNRGLIYAGVKDIEINGNVNFLLPNGYKVHTERIYYSHSRRRIFSETPAELSGPGFLGKVSEWEYDLKTGKAFGRNGVVVKWQP